MSPDPRSIDYQEAVKLCAMLSQLLQPYHLQHLLDAIEHADAIGPILDPTMWRDTHQAMQQDKALLKAALPLWRWGRVQTAGSVAVDQYGWCQCPRDAPCAIPGVHRTPGQRCAKGCLLREGIPIQQEAP